MPSTLYSTAPEILSSRAAEANRIINEYYPYIVNRDVRLPVIVQSDSEFDDVMMVVAPNLISSLCISC